MTPEEAKKQGWLYSPDCGWSKPIKAYPDGSIKYTIVGHNPPEIIKGEK